MWLSDTFGLWTKPFLFHLFFPPTQQLTIWRRSQRKERKERRRSKVRSLLPRWTFYKRERECFVRGTITLVYRTRHDVSLWCLRMGDVYSKNIHVEGILQVRLYVFWTFWKIWCYFSWTECCGYVFAESYRQAARCNKFIEFEVDIFSSSHQYIDRIRLLDWLKSLEE